jgi:arginine N-succinyltransferase
MQGAPFMKVIRPIKAEDHEALERMAFTSSMGIRSLPKDSEQLYEKILMSQKAFKEEMQTPHSHLYIFVLEDLITGAIEGTSGIKAKTAVEEPEYTYRIETVDNSCTTANVPQTLDILKAQIHRNGPTEICGLYLLPHSRMSHLGKLLSYCRFLFIADHPSRFDDTVIAEMRGYFDKEGQNPFWTQVGRHFYDVPFEEALERQSHTTTFIPDILPKFPIYLDLLPREVRSVIGKTHPHTEPALNLLIQSGFSLTNEVDIFDGGPKIWAPMEKVTTIQKSRTATVSDLPSELEEGNWIIANTSLNFRATSAGIRLNEKGITIDKKTAEALGVAIGDTVRYVSI